MNNLELSSMLSTSGAPDVSIFITLVNFLLCVGMSFIVRLFYIKYSVSLTGKHHIGVVIPVLSVVVFLIIMVVKSSLALSLGLVGALSIVRFRTPIKEPEELVYLFLAISLGLGYAAGHTFLTTSISSAILAIIYFWLSNKTMGKNSEYNLVVNWKNKDVSFNDLSTAITDSLQHLKLIRLDHSPSGNTAVMLAIPQKDVTIDLVIEKIQSCDDQADISFYEAKTNW
jgi:hypothetical protein